MLCPTGPLRARPVPPRRRAYLCVQQQRVRAVLREQQVLQLRQRRARAALQAPRAPLVLD